VKNRTNAEGENSIGGLSLISIITICALMLFLLVGGCPSTDHPHHPAGASSPPLLEETPPQNPPAQDEPILGDEFTPEDELQSIILQSIILQTFILLNIIPPQEEEEELFKSTPMLQGIPSAEPPREGREWDVNLSVRAESCPPIATLKR